MRILKEEIQKYKTHKYTNISAPKEELTVNSAHFRPIDEEKKKNTEIQNPQIHKYFCSDGRTYSEFGTL